MITQSAGRKSFSIDRWFSSSFIVSVLSVYNYILVSQLTIAEPTALNNRCVYVWPAHTALRVCNHLVKNKDCVLPQPAYSPDMAPWDYYLFPKLKMVMKDQCYDDVHQRTQYQWSATCSQQHAVSNVQSATCSQQHAVSNVQSATYSQRHAISNKQWTHWSLIADCMLLTADTGISNDQLCCYLRLLSDFCWLFISWILLIRWVLPTRSLFLLG